jgi:dipeptidyl aminopeptidase/acylaminoacyl peptidase
MPRPNFRGSDNLGNAFQRANWRDWGRGPARDVMSGIAELRRRRYVDERRIAVTGWSYGGYLSVWLAGNYPDEWRALVAGAPATDLADQYNLADANIIGRYRWGSPWSEDRVKFYRDESPITYAMKIRTPTLIMANVQDFRVPITQSYKLFRALRDHGVETQFIAYPGRTHSPQDPVGARDVQRRWIQWVERHFGSEQVTER